MVSVIHQHGSATGIYTCFPHTLSPTPASLPILSFQVVPEHWLWVSSSCIKLTLFICLTYGNVYVSRLFFQIILLSPFPTESKYLFLFNFYLNMLETHQVSLIVHASVVFQCYAHTGEHEKVEWHSFCFLNGNSVKGVFSLRHSLSHCNLFRLYPIFFPFISVLFSCSNCRLCLHTFQSFSVKETQQNS